MGTMIWIWGWSNSIKENQKKHSDIVKMYEISNNYKPLDRKFLTKNSDSITILQYKLQNAEYREKLMLLGLWYFGLSDIWKTNHTTVDPEKLANVVSEKMPWIVENTNIRNVDDKRLSQNDVNYDIQSERYGESRMNISSSSESPDDIINSINQTIERIEFDIDYYNDRRQPDSFLNNDRLEYFSDYDTGEAPEIEIEEYNTRDSFEEPQKPEEYRVEPDQNFFPFQ
jgi:hypothetical protein